LARDESAQDLFKYSLLSSSLEYGAEKPRFLSAEQSINYVECHDNATFFDYISSARGNLPLEDRLELSKLAEALVMFSFGIPFFHAGQEIGQSKFGKENSYNLPDVYNKFSYRLLDERKGMYDYFRSLIAFRHKKGFLHVYDPRVIAPMVDLSDEGNLLIVKITDPNEVAPYQEVDFLINPSDNALSHAFKEDRLVLLDTSTITEGFHLALENVLVPKHSLLVVALEKPQ
jgi:pullulanase/glycogen debranching enzyme